MNPYTEDREQSIRDDLRDCNVRLKRALEAVPVSPDAEERRREYVGRILTTKHGLEADLVAAEEGRAELAETFDPQEAAA